MKNGQSLVELLLTIAILSIILPGLLVGFFATRGGRATQDQRQQATAYLYEAQEAMRVIKANGWTNLPDGTYHPVSAGNSWGLADGSELIANNFTRQIIISDIYRDADGNIVSQGGSIDPSTKLVDISVSWTNPLPLSVNSKTYLTRYSNQVHTETTAADFNAGTTNQTQVTNVSGGEVKLANNNKGKWCSPAFSSSTIDLPDGPPVAVTATASAESINTPNDVFAAVAPNDTTSTKLAYVTVSANTDPPIPTLRGMFTLDPAKYSSPSLVPSNIGLDNNFTTNDVKYYTSPAGKLYALLATNKPDREVIAIQINDGTLDSFQDPTNKIYKYWTFFNTKIYGTALNSPTANAAETTSAGDNNGFQSSPTNAYANDGSFAVDTNSGSNTGTSCTGTDKDKHRYYNYGFSLPSGATINGIEMNLVAKADSTSGTPKMCVQLSWDGGTTWTTAKTTNNLTTGSTSYTLGGSADTWGRTWNDAELTDSNFRVRVINVASNTSRDFSLDYAGIKVYYNGISSASNDQAPFDYGVPTINVLGNTGYAASGGYLYTFDLSNIDSKSPNDGLDQLGCRIQLDGFDCKANLGGKKYNAGQTGTSWGATSGSIHPDCSDGGNIELYATNDIFPVLSGGGTYIFTAVGGITNPEFEIANVTSIPNESSNPSISSSSCGRISGGNSGWKVISSYDFNSNPGTEEAANSVFANGDGTRAYISSNGGIDGDGNGQPDSKQYYILDTTNKSSPSFLSGSPSTGPSSGFYNATGANGELYPRRALTVQNGIRAVLVGKDGISNSNDAQEYQVLDSTTEATPTYCGGLNYDIGFNDLTSVSELDGDNYVYMVANTAANELKIIQGGPDNAIFVPSGTFESQIFNATSDAMFNRFYVNATTMPQTTLTYQVAIEHAVNNSCSAASYSYVGPDGTFGTYFATSSALPVNTSGTGYQNPGQCLRYKAYMTSSDQLQTPILYDINFNYSP